MTFNTAAELMDQFIEQTLEIRKLEADLKEKKLDLQRLSELVAEGMAVAGMKRWTDETRGTVYIRAKQVCGLKKGKTQADGAAALSAVGLGELVSPGYSASQVKAALFEMAEDGTLPQELSETFNLLEIATPTLVAG